MLCTASVDWTASQPAYLHIPGIERLALADENWTNQSRGDVSWRVHCAVIYTSQTARVSVQGLVLVHHFPNVGVCLAWQDTVRLVALKEDDKTTRSNVFYFLRHSQKKNWACWSFCEWFRRERGFTSCWVVDSLLCLFDCQSVWVDAVGSWGLVLKNNLWGNKWMCLKMGCKKISSIMGLNVVMFVQWLHRAPVTWKLEIDFLWYMVTRWYLLIIEWYEKTFSAI